MSQPDVVACRWNWCTACSVITVLGADVPDGRALTSWIIGLARQPLFGQGKVAVSGGRDLGAGWAAWLQQSP